MGTESGLSITIIHSLPGRLRLRLSHEPKNVQKMEGTLKSHAGFLTMSYIPITRSVLITYEPNEMSVQELYTRLALVLSLDYEAEPVTVYAEPVHHHIPDVAAVSAAMLAVTSAMRFIGSKKNLTNYFGTVSGITTGFAVIEHGWEEFRERGSFDPEVLSLGYLLTAFIRGNFLKASLVTWAVTFGRHLIDIHDPGIVIRPVASAGNKRRKKPEYEIIIERNHEISDKEKVISALQGLFKYVLSGGVSGPAPLMDDIRKMTKLHSEVLEGMGGMPHGIPITYR